ncbi:lysozyme [Mycoavidus sp. SF9855]|uniref:glycoside hydrolase family protein n=1 Tax=Mycoavidus sp. SF9855 TaxID=2968475 RepID=UPI00211C3C70|nr:lysozyme [Mycoavidus sp. SF9855]UUM21169.1 lysozyme [Mycoavidus sp. SF9855]
MNHKARIVIAALSLSAIGFVSIIESEGFTRKAIIPVKGDRLTIGLGSTVYPDGASVKITDTITVPRALIVAQVHISKDEEWFRASIPNVKLFQEEYDLYLDFVYQYGIESWRTSSMRRHLLAGEYEAACHALLKYKLQGADKFDCSTPGNKRCWGVWTRQLKRYSKCMAVQL